MPPRRAEREVKAVTDYFDLHASNETVNGISSLGLAHPFLSVFSLTVLSWLSLSAYAVARGLHMSTVAFVSAPAQARMVTRIKDLLTPEEQDVFRRGRNASPHSIPQHASRDEYAAATALEALFGWLWLRGEKDRLNELFAVMMEENET